MNIIEKTPKEIVQKLEKTGINFEVPETISSMEEYGKATDIGSQIAKAKKDIEKYRDHFAKPHYDTYKNIRAMFEPFVKELEAKEKEIKAVMLAFHKEEQKRRDEEQARLEAEALENVKDGEDVAVAIVNDIKTIDYGQGRSQVRTLKKWRVTDITKVPVEYLTVNEKLVTEAIKKGIVIEGIEEYEEQSLALSR